MRRSSLSVFGAEGSSKLAIAAHGPSHAPARTASTRAHGPRRLHRRLPRRLPRRQGCPAGISRRSLRRLHGTPRVVLPSAACVHAAVRACALVPARLGGGRACAAAGPGYAAAGPGYAAAGPGYPGRKNCLEDDDHASALARNTHRAVATLKMARGRRGFAPSRGRSAPKLRCPERLPPRMRSATPRSHAATRRAARRSRPPLLQCFKQGRSAARRARWETRPR